jgi:hypothetical protein
MRGTLFVTLVVVASMAPDTTQAQRRHDRREYSVRDDVRRWSRNDRFMSLMVGALDADFAKDRNFPMAALRTDWHLAGPVRAELDATYSIVEVTRPAGSSDADANSNIFTTSLGLQAELPLDVVRPYVGAAVGLFGRFDEEGGRRFVRPTHAFPAGVRIMLSSRLALRGEVRWRFDSSPSGGSSVDREHTVGLSFGY